MLFRETPLFTKLIASIGDDALRAVQLELITDPKAGDLLKGTGGLRKLRMAGEGRGKSGSYRVIYHLYPERPMIYLLLVYAKNVQDDLTAKQAAKLRELVEED